MKGGISANLTNRQVAYLKEPRARIEYRPSEKVFRRWTHDPDFVAARNQRLRGSIKIVAPSGVMSLAADHLLAAASAADDANDTRVRSHLEMYCGCLAWPDQGDADVANDTETVVRDGRSAPS